MNQLKFGSLGETWINLVHLTIENGARVNEECRELLAVQLSYPAVCAGRDRVLDQFADPQMLADIEKVFFSNSPNGLGHSYARLMRGPGGRNDLEDIISLLRAEPASKRAVLTLCGAGDGKVPCINAVQFLVRDNAVQAMYFARGQDVFRKFYADGFCLGQMTQRVAAGLGLAAGKVAGFIGSSHVYLSDQAAIERFLADGRGFLRNGKSNGGS